MPRGRPRKKKEPQEFHFPAAEQPEYKPEDLDAEIDGDASRKESKAVFFTENDIKKKKAAIAAEREVPQIFTPEQVAFVFDLYVGILCFIYSFIFKTDFKPLFEELKFDEAEKMNLAKPLSKVASKYAPSDWASRTAEIELIASVGVYTVMSFKRAETVARREAERKQKEAQQQRQQQHRNAAPVPVTA